MNIQDHVAQILEDVGAAEGAVSIGVFDDEENSKKLLYSETGTLTAPPRPALSTAMANTDQRVVAAVGEMAGKALVGKPVDLASVGRIVLDETQRVINAGVAPPLAESTLQRRRANGRGELPLHDTGEMRDALAVRVGGIDG